MIVRIVKMTFKPEAIPDFLANFNKNKLKIRNFKGCRLVELYQGSEQKEIFFTYSYWDSEADLNAYRASALFGSVWQLTKTYFSDSPQAWSVNKLEILP